MHFGIPSRQPGRLFFYMKHLKILPCLFTVAAVLALGGCATNEGAYVDEQEYSNMPWNTPQQWEGSPSIPGLSGPGY